MEIAILDQNRTRELTQAIKSGLNKKQDKLTGVEGQVVGFDANGNAKPIPGGGGVQILRNWDFRHPVNRNGHSEYATGAGTIHTIDRWALSGHSSTVAKMTLTEDGIRLESANAFRQTIDAEHTLSALRGCMVTFSVLLECVSGANGQIGIVCGGSWLQPVEPLPKTAGQHLIFCTVSIPEDAASITPWYYSATDGAYILKAAKLELGDRQTLARKNAGGEWELIDPPEYDLQYALCSLYSPITGAWVGYPFSNPNLLDNAYWTHRSTIINQRGQAAYETVWGYTIDRWQQSAEGKIMVTDDGLVLEGEGSLDSYAFQRVENLPSGVYTYSALIADNASGASISMAYGQSMTMKSNELVSITFTHDRSVHDENPFFRIHAAGTARFIAAKLESGPVQTLAHKEGDMWVLNDPPPNKALELEKCQKYQFILPQTAAAYSPVGIGNAFNENSVTFMVGIPNQFRAAPAVYAEGGFSITGNGMSGEFDASAAAWSIGPATPANVALVCAGIPYGVESAQLYLLNTNQQNTGKLIFDANL